MFHFVLLMFSCMGCSLGTSSHSFRYDLFHTSHAEPPVYIEKMEKLRTYATTWKLFTRVDLNFYENEHQRLRDEIGKMFTVCAELDNIGVHAIFELASSCKDSVQQMQNIVDEIDQVWKIQMIPAIRGLPTNFDLRVDYKLTFEEIIRTSSTTQNFTTFIDGNEDLFSSNATSKLEQELQVMNRKKITLTNMFSRYFPKQTMKSSLVAQLLQDWLSYSTITFLNYKVSQRNIYDKLVSGKILSSVSLMRELEKLGKSVYTKELDLPLRYDELSTIFYQYVNTQSMLINKTLFFVYMLPLVEPTEFQSYQLQSYPRHIEESLFELLLPDITRVALNKQQKRYFNMDIINLKNCYASENYPKLCELTVPVLSTENSDSCAIELLTQRKVPNCKFRVMTLNHEIWFSLMQQNSWLFVFPKAIEITIKCNGVTDQRYVKGAGTLSITSQCHIKSEHVDIVAYANNVRNEESVFLSSETSVNWTEIINAVKIMNRNITCNTLPKFIKKDSFKLLHDASTSIDEFLFKNETLLKGENEQKLNEENPGENVNVNNLDLASYAINATISLIMSVICFMIVLLCKRKDRVVVRHVKYVRDTNNSEEI